MSIDYNNGKELTDDEAHALTDTLTLHQAAVVKRRIDSLNSTLRKKQKQNAKTDVRDIFPAGPIQQQQSPRSPDSPLTGDHINNGFYSGPQRSSKIRDKGVVFPKKGGYSMSGKRSEVVQDTTDSENSSINQENGLFGVPLQSLLEHDQRVKPDIEVPMKNIASLAKAFSGYLGQLPGSSDINRMGLSNIAMIMAPNLFLSPSNRSKSKGIKDIEITMAAGTSNNILAVFLKEIQSLDVTMEIFRKELQVQKLASDYYNKRQMLKSPGMQLKQKLISLIEDYRIKKNSRCFLVQQY
ncbi:hypothetical protein KUTeg_000591 [Tegillarca granosa]|uniref:Uncharacterized protein n=1 Tax=Tegillarca granosa TaxID=220873 RepID=A0ABQ9G0R7_TEGGR|nr:hypothetical protein KUTeg_000591 [Tegillarca granosa]